jgi:TolB-like protein/Flp pilus assembly protein TadD
LKMRGTLEAVSPVELHDQAARRQLERVVASSGFARNERLSRFLTFVVERHLDGREDEIKESVIAVEVFGRAPGYDSKKDAIVRTEAARLRARLAEYYLEEGKGDPLVIEIPKGRYAPVLRSAGGQKEGDSNSRAVWKIAAAVGFACILLAAAGWWRIHRREPIGIAVLPLENLSNDPANDFFADGLTDELIRNLSLIEGLAPRPRTSSFAFKSRPRNVREIGKELGADYVLEGSVSRAGQHLRIDAQLVRVSDDFLTWSGTFDRELTDVFVIQDEIARGIVNSLRLKLTAGRRRYETNIEAYDAYLRAETLVNQEGLPAYNRSIPMFEEAIAKDRAFAPAYAGETEALAALASTFGNLESQSGLLDKMRVSAEKAVQLDPLLPEAYGARAVAFARDSRWAESEASFRRALELDPNNARSRGDFVMYLLLVLGRTKEALREAQLAAQSDPLSPERQFFLAYTLTLAGRYDEAAFYCENLPAAYRDKPECLGRARLGQGRIQEALEVLAPLHNRGNRGYLGYAYGRAGRRDDAEKLLELIAPNPFNEALVFAGLGDKARTLEALDRMATLGPFRVGRDLRAPEFALVRDDPRLVVLRQKVGLPQ